MDRRAFLAGTAAGTVALAAPHLARAQAATTLRVHQMLPAQATIPRNAIEPWVQRRGGLGRPAEVRAHPAMQLAARPHLYDQAKDGVVDII